MREEVPSSKDLQQLGHVAKCTALLQDNQELLTARSSEEMSNPSRGFQACRYQRMSCGDASFLKLAAAPTMHRATCHACFQAGHRVVAYFIQAMNCMQDVDVRRKCPTQMSWHHFWDMLFDLLCRQSSTLQNVRH